MHLSEKCTRLQTQNSACRFTDSERSQAPRLEQVTDEATHELVNCYLLPDNQPDPSFEQVPYKWHKGAHYSATGKTIALWQDQQRQDRKNSRTYMLFSVRDCKHPKDNDEVCIKHFARESMLDGQFPSGRTTCVNSDVTVTQTLTRVCRLEQVG